MSPEWFFGIAATIMLFFSIFGMAVFGVIVLIYAGEAENARILGIRLVLESKGINDEN